MEYNITPNKNTTNRLFTKKKKKKKLIKQLNSTSSFNHHMIFTFINIPKFVILHVAILFTNSIKKYLLTISIELLVLKKKYNTFMGAANRCHRDTG